MSRAGLPQSRILRQKQAHLSLMAAALASFLAVGTGLWAQSQTPTSGSSSSKPQTKTPDAPTQEAPAEAGGPTGDVGPIAVPKKKEEPPPEPVKRKPPEGLADYSMRVDVPLVNVDVMVMTKNGFFVPGLKKENFRILEDGVPQKVSSFSQSEAPITAVLVVEFGATYGQFIYDALNASYTFANSLKPNDWIAVVSYDMKTHILVDFTQNKGEVFGALHQLRMPMFRETNLFDALYETLDRLDRVEGRKYIILVTTGVDTFSKLNLDQITKKIKATHDVTIFPISVGFAVRNYCESHSCGYTHGMGIPVGEMDYLQGDNEMNTFARLTGGRAYFPRFQADMPGIFRDIVGDIRNQYNLAYHPTNPKLDGTYRKLKVEVVGPDGSPLKVKDQKGKDVKYIVMAREGYTAKHTVE